MTNRPSEDVPLEFPSVANQSAVDAGYRWVAEWERHEATWIAWPHNPKTWPGKFDAIPPVSEQMIRILAEVEHVHVLGGPPASAQIARQTLQNVSNVTVHEIETNDCWIRDFGPTFLLSEDREKLGAVRWKFNAWGNKYPHERDARVSDQVCRALESTGKLHGHVHESTRMLRSFASQMVCEGELWRLMAREH